MVARGKDAYVIATGPYHFDENNVEKFIRNVRFRHFKQDEIQEAQDWVRQYKLPGDYYFDWYLNTTESQRIRNEMQPLDLADACPWMLRIDCVILGRGLDKIVEFTDKVRSSAIGQLVAYENLYATQFNKHGKTEKILVVYDDEPMLHNLCDQNSIRIHLLNHT
jgi:hypothetical protein